MGYRRPQPAAGIREAALLEQHFAHMAWAQRHNVDAHAVGNALRRPLARQLRIDKGDGHVRREAAQVGDELAGVLAAAGVGPIPEGGVEGDVHYARL